MIRKTAVTALLFYLSCSLANAQTGPKSLAKSPPATESKGPRVAVPVKKLGKRAVEKPGVLTSKPEPNAKESRMVIRKFYAERTKNSIRVVAKIENTGLTRESVFMFQMYHLAATNVPPSPAVTGASVDSGSWLAITKFVDKNGNQWDWLRSNYIDEIAPGKIVQLTAEMPMSKKRERFVLVNSYSLKGVAEFELPAIDEEVPKEKRLGKVLSKKPSNTPATGSKRLGKRIFRNLFIEPDDRPEPPLNLASDPVYFVACEYEGTFDVQTAKSFFVDAAKNAMGKKLSVRKAADYYDGIREIGQLRSNTHAVLGWYNERRNQFGFIAVSAAGNTAVNTLDEKGEASKMSDWKWFTWETNGHTVRIKVADNDRGGAFAKFSYDNRLYDDRKHRANP